MPYRTSIVKRTESRCAAPLKKLGMKLIKRGGGYAILAYNEVVDAWVKADGMTPVPYSLSLADVIRLQHEYSADAEVEALEEESADAAPSMAGDREGHRPSNHESASERGALRVIVNQSKPIRDRIGAIEYR